MARRRRSFRGLGASESQHTEWGIKAARSAHEHAKDSAVAAQDGRCQVAHGLLVQANSSYAAAVAHSRSGGRVTLGPLDADIVQARTIFGHYCKITSKFARRR